MSVTENSSRQSSQQFAAMASATGVIGSSPLAQSFFHLLAEGEDAGVHVGHEIMEVQPLFVHQLGLLEEEIHQHGLAAPD